MALNKVTLLPIGVRGTHRLGATGCLCKKVLKAFGSGLVRGGFGESLVISRALLWIRCCQEVGKLHHRLSQ